MILNQLYKIIYQIRNKIRYKMIIIENWRMVEILTISIENSDPIF